MGESIDDIETARFDCVVCYSLVYYQTTASELTFADFQSRPDVIVILGERLSIEDPLMRGSVYGETGCMVLGRLSCWINGWC